MGELCIRMRDGERNERVLLHYSGHSVPRLTANGKICLFNKHHTNYIPLGVAKLRRWLGKPSIVVLDCSGTGVLMPFFADTAPDSNRNNENTNNNAKFAPVVEAAMHRRTYTRYATPLFCA